MGAGGETLTLIGGQKELTLQPLAGGREGGRERPREGGRWESVTTGERRERRATFDMHRGVVIPSSLIELQARLCE